MKKNTSNLTLRLASLVIILSALGFLSTLAISRETPTGAVTGRVYSFDSGSPIKGARVNHPSRGTFVKTDEDGRYTLYGVSKGNHTIRVSAKGFSYSYYKNVMVTEGKATKDIDFKMIRRPSTYYMYAYQKVFSPAEMPEVAFRGYLVKKVALKVYKINPTHYLNYFKTSGAWSWLDTSGRKPVLETTYTARFNEDGDFTGSLRLPLKDTGLYVIKAQAVKGSMKRSTWVLKTDMGLITKRSPSQMLIYAQSFTTGKPLKNAVIRLYQKTRGGTLHLGTGKTDGDGMMIKNHESRNSYKVFASQGQNFAFSSTYSSGSPRNTKVYLYTERPVYRPGQTVYFKGIIRRKSGNSYQVPRGIWAHVKITNTRGTTLFEKNFQANAYGTIHGQFTLGAEPPLGTYSIRTSIDGDRSYSYFEVAEYKKPEFKVEVSTDKPHYVAGDKIKVKVKGLYYFGAPVKGAKFNLTVYESAYRWSRLAWRDYDVENPGYGGIMFETSGKLDEKGQAEIYVPTGKIKYSKNLGIEANVSDISGRTVSGSTSAPLSVGEFALFAITDKYIYSPGDDVTLKIEAMDYKEKPVKNQKVSVEIQSISYEEVKVRRSYMSADGRRHFYDEYKYKEKITSVGPVRWELTDNQGKSQVSFTPSKNGSYVFRLKSKDCRGNEISYDSYLYVSDGSSQGLVSEADIKVITDKNQYEPGEKVKALISCSKPDTYVLVTLEGRKIFERQVLHLKKGAKTITFPLKDEYFPNVFISACAIKDMSMIQEVKNVRINRENRKLKISVKPDKKRYYPGDNARYTVTVLDEKGSPVQAELSLGVVDQAIYAIAPDRTPNIHEFFWNYGYNLVDTTYSFARDYSGGTDKFPRDEIRRDFKDTARWAPVVVTDANGKAVVEFVMPDNLTTWITTVRAATSGTLVGSAVNEVLCTKDLLVRLETPRFITQRDKIKIGGVVHNYTKTDQKVKVWLESVGVKMEGPPNREVTIKPNDSKDFYWLVKAENPGEAKFTLLCQGTTARDAMETKVPIHPFGVEEIIHRSGSLTKKIPSARLDLKLPVTVIKDASRLEVVISPSIAASMLENLDYLISYPYGCVEQTTSPVIAAMSVHRALSGLGIIDRELEEKIRKVADKGMTRLQGMQNYTGGWGWWPGRPANLHMTGYVVLAMKMTQRNGFYVNQKSLDRGVKALRQMVKKKMEPVTDMGGAVQQNEEWNSRAYALYVLYRVGAIEEEKILELFKNRDKLNEYALSMLAMTLDGMGDTKKTTTVMGELDRKAVIEEDQCHWNSRTYTYSWMDDNLEATAYCLEAYVQIQPDDRKIPLIINWLYRRRIGKGYNSTKDTAAVVYALTNYLLKSGEHRPDYKLNVDLNKKPLLSNLHVTTMKLSHKDSVTKASHDKLQTGQNQIDISISGTGNLYYSTRLHYYLNTDVIPAVNRGLQVKRDYFLVTLVKNRKGKLVEHLNALPKRPLHRNEKIRVIIEVTPDKDYRYVIVEDPLPSGFEVDIAESEKNRSGWLAHREIRDEKAVFFVERLHKNKKLVFTYDLRPEMFGLVNILPAQAHCMYEPQVRGHSPSLKVNVDGK